MLFSLKFNQFFINEMNYKMKPIEKKISDHQEELEVETQYKLGVKKDHSKAFIEMDIDISSEVEEINYRSLQLTVVFMFDVSVENDGEIQDKEMRKIILEQLKVEGLVICDIQLRSIIRQFTNIDFSSPIHLSEPIYNTETYKD